jgi:hypothetical protein
MVARITTVATHRCTDYQTQYQEQDIRAFLGVATLILQMIAALERQSRSEEMQAERRKENQYWLLAMTFTCGRFEGEGEADFNTDDSKNRPDLATIVAARGSSFVRSLVNCPGRMIAMLDAHDYQLGLVPDFARTGDIIYVLNGSATPLVLRRAGQDFDLIGECYVHGIIYEEAVSWS